MYGLSPKLKACGHVCTQVEQQNTLHTANRCGDRCNKQEGSSRNATWVDYDSQ